VVRLGIVCEGESELVVFNSVIFKDYLKSINIELIDVQETGSKNQFFEGRLEKHRATLLDKNVDKILFVFDLDKDECLVKSKLDSDIKTGEIGVIAIKEFESWYLADNKAISSLLNKEINVEFPESLDDPIREIISLNNGKGFGRSKPFLAKKMVVNGFSIENAAKHPNCESAKYFIQKLKSLSDK
jgi:hypothetical protein